MKKILLLLFVLLALPIGMQAQGTTWNTATLVKDGETVSGTMDENKPDVWYKFVLEREGNMTFDAKSDANLVIRYISIYSQNAAGTDVTEQDWLYLNETEKPFNVYGLKPGTYFIRLHRNEGAGSYTMKYTYTAPKYQNDPEPNDEWKKAAKLENGQTVQGLLGYYGLGSGTTDREDWYRIEVPDNGTVTLDVHTDNTLTIRYISLFPMNSDGASVYEREYIYLNDGEKPFTVKNVAAGTYYVLLYKENDRGSGSTNKDYGGYTMKYTFTPNPYRGDAEPNDTYDKAIEIKDGETKTGHLGYHYNGSYTDNDDWYKVDVQSGFVKFEIHEDLNTSLDIRYIELFKNNNGSPRSVDYVYVHRGEDHSEFTVTALDDGIYYLRVHREKGEGGYTLTCGSPQRSPDSKIRVSFTGRNKVRLGVPTEYMVTVENIDGRAAEPFFLVIPSTDDIKLLGATLPGKNGYEEKVTMEDFGGQSDLMWFVVPSLAPYESYSFNISAEGLSISGARSNRIGLVTGSIVAIVGLVAINTAIDYVGDKVIDFSTGVICDYIEIDQKEIDYIAHHEMSKEIYKDFATYKDETGVAVVVGKRVVKTVTTQAMNVIPGGKMINFAGELLETTAAFAKALRHRIFFILYKQTGDWERWEKTYGTQNLDTKVGINGVVRSFDPNEMVGPAGVGDKNYIGETKTIDYQILFENKKEATAPAYRIRISDELDENVFDVNSVRFGSTSHEGTQYNWKMSREGNKLSWDIEGIELPPNVNAPEGEGYVTFSVDLKPGLKSGTQIKNKATIIFDKNEPIVTNEYLNTLDLVAPVAKMKAVSKQSDGKFLVTCEGSDSESGISHYLFYASKDGADYEFLDMSADPSLSFEAKSNANYSIIAYAVDNVGNCQATAPEPIAFNPSGIHTLSVLPDDTWTITSLNGTVVASGKGVPSAPLAKGVYIIRQGSTTRKVVLK